MPTSDLLANCTQKNSLFNNACIKFIPNEILPSRPIDRKTVMNQAIKLANQKIIVQPAIVIPAYQRPNSLQRLLNSLAQADYTGYDNVPLLISVDYSDHAEVAQIADEFQWQFGTKEVIKHSTNLGLKGNVLFCGDLTEQYQAVIVLEDDLFVAPYFYDYACQALNFYQSCSEISGISLYSYNFNEYPKVRFIPLDDGFDNYFVQSATSWGQLWTQQQWQEFKVWYQEYGEIPISQDDLLPDTIINRWSPQSWKKYFIKYMVLTNKYFVVPRISLATNFGEIGKHISLSTNNLQVPLIMGKKSWRFSHLSQSNSIYDCHYEIHDHCLKKLNNFLHDFDFECDLYGTKNLEKVKSEYIITLRNTIQKVESYALRMIPHELNLALALKGDFFNLTKVKDCSNIQIQKKLAQYICLHQDAGIKRFGALSIYNLVNRLGKKKSLKSGLIKFNLLN